MRKVMLLSLMLVSGGAAKEEILSVQRYRQGDTEVEVVHHRGEAIICVFRDGAMVFKKWYFSPDGGHGSGVLDVAISPDGRRVACQLTSSGGHQPYFTPIEVVDAKAGQQLDWDYPGVEAEGPARKTPTGDWEEGKFEWVDNQRLRFPVVDLREEEWKYENVVVEIPENQPPAPWPDPGREPELHLRCIFALDKNRAWVGGRLAKDGNDYHTALYRTEDGGKTWQRTGPAIGSDEVFSIYFEDAHTGWAAGACTMESFGDPFVLRTRDGGATWARSDLPMGNRHTPLFVPTSIEFLTSRLGVLRASGPVIEEEQAIYYTYDGGKTWAYSHGRLEVGPDSRGAAWNTFSVTRGGVRWKIEKGEVLVAPPGDDQPWRKTEGQPVDLSGEPGEDSGD